MSRVSAAFIIRSPFRHVFATSTGHIGNSCCSLGPSQLAALDSGPCLLPVGADAEAARVAGSVRTRGVGEGVLGGARPGPRAVLQGGRPISQAAQTSTARRKRLCPNCVCNAGSAGSLRMLLQEGSFTRTFWQPWASRARPPPLRSRLHGMDC